MTSQPQHIRARKSDCSAPADSLLPKAAEASPSCAARNNEPPLSSELSLFRETVLQYAGAKRALAELYRHGVDPDEFLNVLESSANLQRRDGPKRQPDYEIPGMPPRRLLTLATQMEGTARELDAIESHPFMNDTFALLSAENRESLSKLPSLLRERAFLLHVHVSVQKRLYPRVYREIEKRARLSLIDFVRQSTKNRRAMYSEVALLLTAGFHAVGRDETVTPGSLRTLWNADKAL